MNKQTLIERLEKGFNAYDARDIPSKLGNSDRHHLKIKEGYAECYRSWAYDDQDMCEDYGTSSATITRSEADRFIDDVIASGSCKRRFNSTNSFDSFARDSGGASETISHSNYFGQVELNVSIQGDKIVFRFFPSVPQEPTMRLSADRDYLIVDKVDQAKGHEPKPPA